MKLDSIDLRILDELQRDGSLSNVELAKRVHLSPSPCLARVKALESGGIIVRYVALAKAAALGLGLNVLISISLRSEEHTSELQSLMRISYAVFCLKNKHKKNTTINSNNPPTRTH